jgi:twitching motility two-component system response regulator PilG
MAQTQDALLLREAVTAAKVGNKAAARQLLRQARVHNPNNELVWLWRASLSESPKEAIFYLGEVLRINPQNQKASAWLDKCKGHTPAATPADGPKPVGQNVSQPPEPSPASPGVTTPASSHAPSTAPAPAASKPLHAQPAAQPAAIPMPAAQPSSIPGMAAHSSHATPGIQPKPVAVAQSTSQTFVQPAAVGSPITPVVTPAVTAPVSPSVATSGTLSGTGSIQNLAKNIQATAHSTTVEAAPAAVGVRVVESRIADNRVAESYVSDHGAGKLVESRPKPTVIPFVSSKSLPAPALKTSAQPAIAAESTHKWQCPFCAEAGDTVHKRCPTCHAITVLDDLKEIEKNEGVQEKFVRDALARYEAIAAEKRTFEQNSALALGHLNLREATSAIPYLKAATAQRKNEWALLGVLDQLQWRKVVMVVDDSLTIRKALSSILEKNDYRVLTAEDGSHALELLNETVPDLVLLDITMPWMDGYQVCKHIKEKALTRKVPVVMLSGKDGLFDKVRGKLAGCNDYVTKPFDPDALLKTIKKYLP